MINYQSKYTGDLGAALDRYEKDVREKVLISSAAAAARVIYDEVKLNTSGVRKGGPGDPPGVKTGTLHNAVYRVFSKENSDADRAMYRVSVNKTKAPHWHLLEYGHIGAAAYPYLRPAFDKVHEAIEAGRMRMRERLLGGEGVSISE